VPDRYQIQLDGEASNSFLGRNDPDANYATYLRQWQRITGYRRVFVRTEVGNQVSAIQSLVSVFRTADGALAALNFNHDRLRNAQFVAVTDGAFGINSYLVVDRSNEAATTFSLAWVDGNVLASIDLTSPPRVGPAPADASDLAGKVHRRIVADIT